MKHISGLDEALFDGCGHRDQLLRRSRLIQVGDGSIAKRLRIHSGTLVGIERRQVSHRQDLTGLGLENDHRAPGRPESIHRPSQRLLGLELDFTIDGEHQVSSRLRWHEFVFPQGNIHLPGPVLFDEQLPRTSLEYLIVRQLQALQSDVVVLAHEPDDVGCQPTRWVSPTWLLSEIDTGQIEITDHLGPAPVQLAGYVDEPGVAPQALLQVLGFDAGEWRNQPSRCGWIFHLERVGVHRDGIHGDGQLVAVAIEDRPPVGGQDLPAQTLLHATSCVCLGTYRLHLEQTSSYRDPGQQQHGPDRQQSNVQCASGRTAHS